MEANLWMHAKNSTPLISGSANYLTLLLEGDIPMLITKSRKVHLHT